MGSEPTPPTGNAATIALERICCISSRCSAIGGFWVWEWGGFCGEMYRNSHHDRIFRFYNKSFTFHAKSHTQDPPMLASRCESTSPPGAVHISEECYQKVRARVAFGWVVGYLSAVRAREFDLRFGVRAPARISFVRSPDKYLPVNEKTLLGPRHLYCSVRGKTFRW